MTIDRLSYRSTFSVLAVLILIPTYRTSLAQQFEPTWRLKLDLAFVNPSGEAVSVDVGASGIDVDFDNKVGAGLRAEYSFRETLAIEVGVLGTSSIDVTVGDLGDAVGVATRISNFAPFTAGVNYHFAPDGAVDLYAGPFVAIVNYGDIDVEASTGGVATSLSVDSDFGWGAIAGLDIPLGTGHWSLQSNIRYIDTAIKGESNGDPFDGSFDPFIFSIGIGYRF